jgi:hypothetical protein
MALSEEAAEQLADRYGVDAADVALMDELIQQRLDDRDSDGGGLTRRGALAGMAGALGLTAATSSASAEDTSTGRTGGPGVSADVYLDEIFDESGDLVLDVDDTGGLAWQRASTFPAATAGDLEATGSFTYPDGTTVTSPPSGSGGGGRLTEDPNSPLTISGSSSGTVTLSDTYTEGVLLFFTDAGATQLTPMEMYVNGDTGSNYSYVSASGSSTSADTSVPVEWDERIVGQSMRLAADWTDAWTATCPVTLSTSAATGAWNRTVSGPLSSITFQSSNGDPLTLNVEVWGR